MTKNEAIQRIHELAEENRSLRVIIGNIESIRQSEGNSVTILCDNPEADSVDRQSGVEACCDFTDWQTVRVYAASWADALQELGNRARTFYAREDSNDL